MSHMTANKPRTQRLSNLPAIESPGAADAQGEGVYPAVGEFVAEYQWDMAFDNPYTAPEGWTVCGEPTVCCFHQLGHDGKGKHPWASFMIKRLRPRRRQLLVHQPTGECSMRRLRLSGSDGRGEGYQGRGGDGRMNNCSKCKMVGICTVSMALVETYDTLCVAIGERQLTLCFDEWQTTAARYCGYYTPIDESEANRGD